MFLTLEFHLNLFHLNHLNIFQVEPPGEQERSDDDSLLRTGEFEGTAGELDFSRVGGDEKRKEGARRTTSDLQKDIDQVCK